MGVLYDYFRAADDAAAAMAADRPGGPLAADGTGAGAFDGVAARGIDPVVSLGHLIGYVRGVPWTPDLVAAEEVARSSVSEAWVERLGPPVRDWLADAVDDLLPETVAKWCQFDELANGDDADEVMLLSLVGDLVGLARRARAAGDRLYCWCCL